MITKRKHRKTGMPRTGRPPVIPDEDMADAEVMGMPQDQYIQIEGRVRLYCHDTNQRVLIDRLEQLAKAAGFNLTRQAAASIDAGARIYRHWTLRRVPLDIVHAALADHPGLTIRELAPHIYRNKEHNELWNEEARKAAEQKTYVALRRLGGRVVSRYNAEGERLWFQANHHMVRAFAPTPVGGDFRKPEL